MGQYYKVFLKGSEGIICPENIDGGLKLTEHSWVGNFFVTSVVKYLLKHRSTVVWCGDYADDVAETFNVKRAGVSFQKVYQSCYGEAAQMTPRLDKEYKVQSEAHAQRVTDSYGYMVNYTTKEYVDMKKYIVENTTKDGWCIHPLPLLTAIGNGRGGGDYRGVNMDLVGLWCGCKIGFNKTKPQSGKDITNKVRFSEGG